MDSLITMVTGVISNHIPVTNLIIFVLGFVIPILVGMILPRKKTIGYGRIIYKFLGTLLAQKRLHTIPTSILASIITVVRATFVDMSYGVYIESRTDITNEDKDKKIQEYLNLTLVKPQPEEPQPKP